MANEILLYMSAADGPVPGEVCINAFDEFKRLIDGMDFETLKKFAIQITCMQEWAGPALDEQRAYLQEKLENGPRSKPSL